MTLPNILSLSRVPLLFVVLAGLVIPFPGGPTLALVAFVLAVLTDWFDGFFARLFKQVTTTGTLMDALIDKVFIHGLFIYFLFTGLIPSWGLLPLIAMLAREFVITGLRQCALIKGQIISTEIHGKIKTVMQFLSLFFFVLVPFFQKDMGESPDILAWSDFFKFAARITFALAATLTITSGFYYLKTYWRVLSQDDKLPPPGEKQV